MKTIQGQAHVHEIEWNYLDEPEQAPCNLQYIAIGHIHADGHIHAQDS